MRVASSRLVGRAAELAELEAVLAEAAEGRPSVVFVAGESGVGKTRLLTELMRRAGEQGALVLAGDTVDYGGESELPYHPLVAALRPLARSDDPALTEPVREAAAPLLLGLGPAGGRPGSALDQRDQALVFEGLLRLLDALGQDRVVLLVIEDLHWADRSTRAALAFLARNLTEERLLVVGSYRSHELPSRNHPVRSLLAELERAPRARRVELSPLTRDELADQLEDILGAAPATDLLERLWARSGGNPLFAEELLAGGADGRGPAPDTLRDALMLRVERLSGPSREVLGLVAVGQRLDHRVLEVACPLDARALRDALREAVDAHILAVHADGTYRFRHALLREVVEHDLLPGERRELHLALARALEQRLEEGADAQTTAAIAYHFDAAGEACAALGAAIRAAGDAERVHAHGELLALLERALELWERPPDSEACAGIERTALLSWAAEAAAAVGDAGRQLVHLDAAFAGLGARPDPARAIPILEATARAQRHHNRAGDSIATLERALGLLEADGDASLRAGVLAGLARAYMIAGRFADAIRVAGQALEAADAEGLPLVEGSARNTRGCSIAMAGAVDEGAAELREAIRLAREQDSVEDLVTAYDNLAGLLHGAGRSAEARSVLGEGREAVEGRRPIATAWLDAKLAAIAFDIGDWDRAGSVLPAVQHWTGDQARLGLGFRRAELAAGRGDDAAASAALSELEPLAAESGEPQLLAPLAALTADLLRRGGDLAAARRAVDDGFGRIDARSPEAPQGAVLAAMGVTVEADAAVRARDLGDADAEAAALQRIEDLLARVAAAAVPGRPVEAAVLMSARADAGRAAADGDPADYARAAAAWDRVGRPEPAARMRWREAEMRVAAGDREGAAKAARAAHAAAAGIGAGWLLGEIEGLAARARITLEPDGEHDEAADDDAFGLTTRERQVLSLIAEGATNREIGATLFMAEKTASVHVSRILAKLNVRSRTEAATVAHRHRLVSGGAETLDER